MTITDKQVEAACAAAGQMGFSAVEMTDNEIRAIREAAEAAKECGTCEGRGEAGGPVGQTAESFGYVSEPCPDCATPSSAEQPAKDRALAARYAQAARVIALWLKEFCDESLRYDEMIADAARKAAAEIERLKAPGAPEADERSRFEAWAKPRAMDLTRMKDVPYLCSSSDEYYCNPAETGWAAWQARAQSSAAPPVSFADKAAAVGEVSDFGKALLFCAAYALPPRTLLYAAPVSARDGEAVATGATLRYFSWDDETSFETHATLDAARKASLESLDLYREEAAEGWPEQTDNLCYGVILGGARVISTRPMTENEAAHYGEAGEIINYGLVDDAAAFTPPADARDGELERLRALLNTPELHDFAQAVVLEAAHQRERWGSDHDAGKEPADWFWLLGYLSGKALRANLDGDADKAKHHTISSAAALANWHAAIAGTHTAMRPGIEPPAAIDRAMGPTPAGAEGGG